MSVSTWAGGGRWTRLARWLSRAWDGIHAGPRVRAGVTAAAVGLVGVMAVGLAWNIRVGVGPTMDFVSAVALFIVLASAGALVTALAVGLLGVFTSLFSRWSFFVLAGTLGAIGVLSPFSLVPGLPVLAMLLALGACAGGLRSGSVVKRRVLAVLTAVVLAASGTIVYVYASRGGDAHLVGFEADPVDPGLLDAPDPSTPGSYPVATLTYGSGSDRRRPEFGAGVTLLTDPVDARAFLEGNEGWRMGLRTWYWGFDLDALPLNGRVWYPETGGPFPLVLIVHGNHNMEEYSDPGYEYLGELLASRGYIVVSIDENFLNSSFRGSLGSENDARAWMLLEHLRVWRGWNGDVEHPFFGRVDLDRVALVGHSRGGEAAAIAGAFNRLSRYPDDATIEFDYDFGIRAVVAIAPSDGQYEPAERPTSLTNVSYLVLQGGHDADMSFFAGARQYRRVELREAQFKASVYVYRANHGQFNTVWGDDDYGWPLTTMVNRRPLMAGDDQRQVAKVYISAFLDATLRDDARYVPLFRDHRVGSHWLPEDYYITRYEDATLRRVADFEEDVDASTTRLGGAWIEGTNLELWREELQNYRSPRDSKRNGVAVVGWRRTSDGEDGAARERGDTGDGSRVPSYRIVLSREAVEWLALTSESVLVFSLAVADEETAEAVFRSEDGAADVGRLERDEQRPGGERSLDLTVVLEVDGGASVSFPLSTIRRVPVELKSRLTKLPMEAALFGSAWEPTLQTFRIPLAEVASRSSEFDPQGLRRIGFVFDRAASGAILLDDIGFAEAVLPEFPPLSALSDDEQPEA